MSEKQPGELVIYHGGFLSPQKRKLVTLIAHAAAKGVKVRFWADIDAGGFRMFDNLQKLISSVLPMRMSGEFVNFFTSMVLNVPKSIYPPCKSIWRMENIRYFEMQ